MLESELIQARKAGCTPGEYRCRGSAIDCHLNTGANIDTRVQISRIRTQTSTKQGNDVGLPIGSSCGEWSGSEREAVQRSSRAGSALVEGEEAWRN